MNIFEQIIHDLTVEGSIEQSRHLARFFKTGKGQYGEGDFFLGVRVPVTRKIVSGYCDSATLDDVSSLLASKWHEARLAGFFVLIRMFERALRLKDTTLTDELVSFYIDRLDRANNWDLVDLVAPKILGRYIVLHPEKADILYSLSLRADSLWHRRTAMVATWTMICAGRFDVTLHLAERYLSEKHDLMHKATGWMLREMGKRGGMSELTAFLDRYAATMPRTALRYAIERLDPETRRHYMYIK